MKSKLTLTIGIPVYNEEANIANLLDSILSQKQDNYVLEKIIVVSDGSTDNTEQIVEEFSTKYPNVKLIALKKREGKKRRLEKLYQINSSEVLIISDGDILLSELTVISKMINQFSNKNVAIVSANNQPIEAQNFQGKVINSLYSLWYEIRKDFKNGNNIYNIKGCFMAIRNEFAKRVKFRDDSISEAQFLFFCLKQGNLEFRFTEDSVVLFRLPSSFREHFLLKTRGGKGRDQLSKYFGKSVYSEYRIPAVLKIKGFTSMFIKNPINAVMAIVFQFILSRRIKSIKSVSKNNLWQIASSTKKGIYVNF